MKKFIAIFLTCWLALLSWLPSVHAETFINANQLDAAAALAIDAKTGQILYSQNINQKLPIASISKLLTVMVIEDEISQHQLSWNTKVKINQKVAAIADDPEYSNVSLTQGQSYTVSDLVKAALIKSADGATVALAGALGDSTAQFNQKLQKKARQIGIKDAIIVNSVGLTNSQLKDLAVKNIDDNASLIKRFGQSCFLRSQTAIGNQLIQLLRCRKTGIRAIAIGMQHHRYNAPILESCRADQTGTGSI